MTIIDIDTPDNCIECPFSGMDFECRLYLSDTYGVQISDFDDCRPPECPLMSLEQYNGRRRMQRRERLGWIE